MTPTDNLLRDGVIMLGAALPSVLLFRRFGLGAVLGYLVAGVLVGPQVLDIVGDAQGKLGIAEIGITLLLFLVGLELNPRRLWDLRREIFGFGTAQVVVAGLAITGVIWGFAGFSPKAALALGLPLALSSTAQVLPLLRSQGRLHTQFGERAFSILLFQDLSIIPLITIITALSRAPIDHNAPPGWLLGLYTVGAIIALVLAGRYVLTPALRLIGNLGEREMFVAAGLFTVLAASALMEWLHLSTALGAFVAGVMLADSPYRHEIEADVEPFRSILLGLFFLTIGMLLDLSAIATRPLFVLGIAVALIVVKTLVLFGIAKIAKMETRSAFALGLLLSQGGEFGFVLFGQAQAAYLIAPQAASLFSAVVTLSMATTPFLMSLARRFGGDEAGAKLRGIAGPEEAEQGQAIVVGYGRFGQTVTQMLFAHGMSLTIVDLDTEIIDIGDRMEIKVYYGDGTRLDLLRQAGADEAELICFCIDGEQQPSTDVLEAVQEAFPHARLLVRVFDRRDVLALKKIGIAPQAVREVMESAVKMGRMALETVGVEGDEIDRIEADYRERDLRRLRAQHEAGELRASTASALLYRPGRAPDALDEQAEA
ncbi:cation:proton antiporter [Sphingomonas sp. CGMCC 1.13654]|uniref:Cation:proton antiporter n=1 Tax=Sphingomonas chungangi TaxID=2683589 RepID=A0A838L6M6_9SPHN|nr:cation:proton antiporter [Sphingomonas chungangi]MBA2933228.1 cation:proton antiporter [Sphingomonas chungangi]MVW57899.1 sodium:proton exchanger [Sphingomonas chungangi]